VDFLTIGKCTIYITTLSQIDLYPAREHWLLHVFGESSLGNRIEIGFSFPIPALSTFENNTSVMA
jgi:hypothetical protein